MLTANRKGIETSELTPQDTTIVVNDGHSALGFTEAEDEMVCP